MSRLFDRARGSQQDDAAPELAAQHDAEPLGAAWRASRHNAVMEESGGDFFARLADGLSPHHRFVLLSHAERVQTLRATGAAERAALLSELSAGEVRDVLLDAGLEDGDLFRLIARYTDAHGPEMLHGLPLGQLNVIFFEPRTGQAALFARLTTAQQLQLFPLQLIRQQGTMFPHRASGALKGALLSTITDQDLASLLQSFEEDEVRALAEAVPPHVADRVRRAADVTYPHLFAYDQVREGEADENAASSEAWYAEQTPHKARKPRGPVPMVDTWVELPWEERVSVFHDAHLERRVSYLRREPDSKARMLRTIDGSELIETVAAYTRKYGYGDDLVRGLPGDALLDSLLTLDDPRALVEIYPRLTDGQRQLILPAISPRQLATLLTGTPEARIEALWDDVAGLSADTVAAALRRLDDVELYTLHSQLGGAAQADLIARLPPQRQQALAPDPEE